MTHDALKRVPWLSRVGDKELAEFAVSAHVARFHPGQNLVAELELGESIFIIIDGQAEVTVAGGRDRRHVGTLGPGDACGEVSLLTHALHSATVTAASNLTALRIGRIQFEALMGRNPTILLYFAKIIAKRTADTDSALQALLDEAAPTDLAQAGIAGRSTGLVAGGGSIRRAWRELVISRRRELPFVALAAFMATLLAIRVLVAFLDAAKLGLFGFLRDAYIAGIVLLLVSTAVSLVFFRPGLQRAVAVTFGVGFALILNELSVFLTFDTFYLDMTTPDPTLVFSVEALYRRHESTWAILLALAFLVQLSFLGRFYRRAFFVLGAQITSWVKGSG